MMRLVYVQIIEADSNIRLSRRNSMRMRVVVPPRGRIYDRNGEVLARNRPSYSISVLPYKLGNNRERVIQSLCKIRDLDGNAVFDSLTLSEQIRRASFRRFDATRLKEDVPIEIVSIVEEHSMELPGIIVEIESRREYTMGASTFHVIGYMGEIPEREFDTLRHNDYYWGDLIGRAGIERQYESFMRGTTGREYLEVNAHGKSLGTLENIPRIEPVLGNDLFLTIDARLQRVTAEAFPDSLKGAVVALDPRNGEVLVMFSNPSVDANIFSMASSQRSQSWSEVSRDPDLPLNNRAIAGTYPPGSTFKLISGLAAIHEGEIIGRTRMSTPCRGAYRIGNRVARCWKREGHGNVDFIGSMAQSCNVYYYQLGLILGDEPINRKARLLGLGTPTGVDIPGERAGWLSGRDAYNLRFASRGFTWQTGMLLDHAIGQTQILTPIQMAVMVGGLANGEAIYKPYILKEQRNNDGIVVNQSQPRLKNNLDFDHKHKEIIRDALASVVLPGGTGTRSAVPGIQVGGKTGSAQNPHGELTHALYVAAAPVEDPVIAIAVVVENSGGGGAVAAPLAGEILRYYFANTEEGIQVVEEAQKRKIQENAATAYR
ncbi:Cell division protein FtsI [Peptidoglycan synthetase] [Chitinispirillum alkaliphilum]|nr:Cell division protein FtsI [Peptidoglycan synthetase] [Chitinispirillum alkaliphilum]